MPEKFICGKCGKVAKTKQALERHAAYHEDERPFSCEVCLQRFKNSDDRGKHYRRLKKDGKFSIACTVCHKHFKTQDILQKHMEMLGCNVPAVENVCSQEPTDDKNSIDTDQDAEIANEKPLPGEGISCTCKICETEFVNTKSLKKHYVEVHRDSKRQVCIQCGQTLSSKDSLARHFSIFHQTSFPFSCNICNQKFKIKESLCRHVKFVHQDGGYECTECNRVFTQPVNLRKHLAVHSTQKEYTCKFCGREFRWKQAVQKHELLHTSQNTCASVQADDEESTGGESNIERKEHSEERNYEKSCNRVDVGDIEIEDLTDKVIGRKLKDHSKISTNGSIGSNRTHQRLSTYSRNSHRQSDSCTRAQESIDFSPRTRTDYRYQDCLENRVNDEYTFHADDITDIDTTRACLSRKNRQTPFLKRNHEDDDINNEEYKKLKVTDNFIVHRERHSSQSENGAAFTADFCDSARCKCNDNEHLDLEMAADSVHELNNRDNTANEKENPASDNTNRLLVNETRLQIDSRDESIQNDTEVHKLEYSYFTSFPTEKTTDAPKLVFKPSSIQVIMASTEKEESKSDTTTLQKIGTQATPVNRKALFKFPVTSGSLHTKLHNPFIIQNSCEISANESSPVAGTSSSDIFGKENNKCALRNGTERSKQVIAPPEHKVPSGKFSLVKHMLSLQNEDNFDKTIFENPLYSKPADVKDFELMVERHKVVDKSDNDVIQYDLSAKQNIPFHWLGMSVSKKKNTNAKNKLEGNSFEDRQINNKDRDSSDLIGLKATRTVCHTGSSDEVTKETVSHENNEIRRFQTSYKPNIERSPTQSSGQVQRAFQAMKCLVAQRSKTGELYQNNKSVLSNPFDYPSHQYLNNVPEGVIQSQPAEMLSYTHKKHVSPNKTVGLEDNFGRHTIADNAGMSTEVEQFNDPIHRRRQLSLDSKPMTAPTDDKCFPLAKSSTGLPLAPEISTSQVHLGRSYSLPSYSNCNNVNTKLWQKKSENINVNYLHQQRMYNSGASAYQSAKNLPEGHYEGHVKMTKPELSSLQTSSQNLQVDSHGRKQCENVNVSNASGLAKQLLETENFETDFAETSKFDAYNMIDSPYGNTTTQLSVSAKSRYTVVSGKAEGASNLKAPSGFQPYKTAEPLLINERYARFSVPENRNAGARTAEHENNVKDSVECCWQQKSKPSDETILDMFRLVQEGKGNDYDNIASLLTDYV